MTVVLLLLAVLAGTCPAAAADPDAAFTRANEAFAAGRWEEAAKGYEAIARTDGVSAALLGNLGNAYVRAGRLGAAILAYERAHWLAPRDPDAAANLAHARDLAGLPDAQPTWWRQLRDVFAPDTWGWLTLAALAAAGAGVLVRLTGEHPRSSATLVAATAAGVLVVGVLACATLAGDLARAIIVTDAPLRTAPFAAAETRRTLRAGTAVRVVQRHEGFLLVHGDDGGSGWVADGQVERVVPGA